MGFFSELEGNLEKYIEGFFKDKFGGGGLQPVDIAKKLAREMRDRRRVGLKDIYVPNRFEVILGPKDYAAVSPLMDRLSAEMVDYVKNKAVEKKYTLLGAVAVSFMEREQLPRGQVEINSFFDECVEEKPETVEDTMRFTPVRGVPEPERNVTVLLEVVEGALAGKKFVLEGNQVTIGRGEICDICLPDNSISRRHAVINRTGRHFVIRDRSSTNGTYVNGVKVAQIELSHGDVVKMGNTVLIFKVE
ncbi:FhaA domain-containing protein [Desulfallas thermosapovorans]|uniref:Type III secretion system (T3SS) inner membrane Yop/YscD-like protein n=1 Tax=Desulfallas thermosapovorans DSM 6562 TaxID=1121431 RepID=A0A5S4ZWP6_9FIRM|nr:DUF3662 and FHA domain-containing protein [Desulfallas thermosapovorans]TYO97376.1 type III secretion system (T3SS) inner membrane Yop/YscD-like protein [Desulfallas thermosapovorans DSM 6562]